MNSNNEDIKPWYKQGWPWFLIALPASAVIAGIATIIIATKNSDSLVKADYYKEGLAINQSIEQQKKAKSLALSFTLERADSSLSITTVKELKTPVLYLFLQHPADPEKDTTVVLNRSSNVLSYQGNAEQIYDVNYRVTLYPPEQDWKILARWQPENESPKTLTP